MNSFNHLRIYSEYSVGRSIIQIDSLIKKAKKYQVQSLAITDLNNIFAAVKFYRAACSAQIKPIIAAEVSYQYCDDPKVYQIALYCQNKQGYQNLSFIISEIYQSSQRLKNKIFKPTKHNLAVNFDFLVSHSEGLIALNGGIKSDLFNHSEKKNYRVENWLKAFGNRFYLEVHNPKEAEQKKWIANALVLASQHDIATVATHPTFFLEKEDFTAHQIRTSIDQKVRLDSPERIPIATKNQFFLNSSEFRDQFKDFDENLIKNSEVIAQRCNFKFVFGVIHAPKFKTEVGLSEAQSLVELSHKGLAVKTSSFNLSPLKQKEYVNRLSYELEIIEKMQFSGYFLVVADYVNWAKSNNVPVAPGRGSGAGSLVAFALNITDIDPIKYDLIFERFLNQQRETMPDFDIDFCAYKRSKVLSYIREKYQKQIPVQIITFGSMNAKGVVRDVARALSYPYGVGDRIAKEIGGDFKLSQLIGNQKNVLKERLEQARLAAKNSDESYEKNKTEEEIRAEVKDFFVKAAKFQQLYQEDEEVKDVVDNSIKLEGLVRNVGTHAGGVIIAPDDIRKFCPIYCDPDKPSQFVSQFDMKSVEKIGLIKFDFLGVTALSVIKRCLEVIEKNYGKKIDLLGIKTNDKKVYSFLRKGWTCGIFQLESLGCTRMIIKMGIENFDELIASLALHRPGPLGSNMDKDFIKIKKGLLNPKYLLPELEPILSATKGLLIYQEQVMKIAQEICGFSLGHADVLRHAMGKKDELRMREQKKPFIAGGVKKGHPKEKIEKIFEQIQKFAEYGFNKSHSVAYALISYYTAYLKTYYPAVFYACEMSEHFNNSKSLYARILEIKKFGKVILNEPNINTDEYLFKFHSKKEVLYALGAIKGVGANAAEEIICKREKDGLFKNFSDFCLRVDLSKVNKGAIKSLINSGAMDKLAPFERKVKIDNLVNLMRTSTQFKKGSELGMMSLFGVEQESQFDFKFINQSKGDFANFEKLDYQFKALGYYPNETPIDYYHYELNHLTKIIDIQTLVSNKFKHKKEGEFYLITSVEYFSQDVFEKKVIGRIRVSDSKGNNYEIRTSLEKFNEIQETLKKNKHIVCLISIDFNYSVHLIELYSLADFRAKELEFIFDLTKQSPEEIDLISEKIKQWFKDAVKFGSATLLVQSQSEKNKFLLDLGENYRFYPTDKNLDQLQYLTDFRLRFRPKKLI